LILRLGHIILDRLYIAVPLGFVVGLVMMALMMFLPKLEKTGVPLKRLPYTLVGTLLAFVIGGGALFAYHSLAPHYFVWFGVMVIVTFLVSIALKTVPQISQLKRRV